MDQSLEEWRPVVGHEGFFEVSSIGRVRSVTRTVPMTTRWGVATTRTIQSIIRRPGTSRKGYLNVTLMKCGVKTQAGVHVLVAEAFLGERPDWADQINHIDKCRTNNCVNNLEWSNSLLNNRHARATYLWEGRLLCSTELAEMSGLGAKAIRTRLARGWSLEDVMAMRVMA